MSVVTPLIKWPGGKRWIIRIIVPFLEGSYKRYIEPFLGGGAVFFALEAKKALLSDINEDLIQCYLALKDDITKVFGIIEKFPKGKRGYYEIRDNWRPAAKYKDAARFIYLLRHSWNGLYRVNKDGAFNVPFRKRTYKSRITKSYLSQIQKKLCKATILHSDFQKLVDRSRSGDLIFIDPPYYCNGEDGFHRYTSEYFSLEDQKRLYSSLVRAEKRGAFWVLTNVDYAFVKLFKTDYEVFKVRRKQTLAGDAKKRRYMYEYIVLSNSEELANLRKELNARKNKNRP